MKFHSESFKPVTQTRNRSPREMLFLAEQSAEGDIKVLPGKNWALHYPTAGNRDEKIRGILDGRYTAEDVENDLRPDALIYSTEDLETQGIEAVSARIREASSYIANYDYSKFARFVESMRGREMSLEAIDSLYSGITRTRVQDKLLKAYGATGKAQIESALKHEIKDLQQMVGKTRIEKVLHALKLDWLHENLQLASSEDRDRALAELSGDERKAFHELRDSYREYVATGKDEPYRNLIDAVKEAIPSIQKDASEESRSESMQQLEEELKQFEEQVGPPGSDKDPGIPPEDKDEYQTPPVFPGEQEKDKHKPIFEITPPLSGYYASGRNSYFDVDTKTWSKKKRLSLYNESLEGEERHTISGPTEAGIKSVPVPVGYALDIKSLQVFGATAEIFRDQNGCFYIKATKLCNYKIDFVKEQDTFISPPISEDSYALYRGQLSSESESLISRLAGSPEDKARQARQHILAHHFYPGGGDLKVAQALQYKLRQESSGDNYLQNVDMSEYLECYSANTKFIAIMRKAGVPARLVRGHRVKGSKNKGVIDGSTGHAWSEIWNGNSWVRFDATPKSKPEDRKDDQGNSETNENSEGEEEGSGDGKQGESQGKGSSNQDSSKEQREGEKNDDPTENISEASDIDIQEASNRLEQAKKQVDEELQKQRQFNESIEQSKNFEDLSKLKDQIEQSDLPEDIKEDIQNRLDAKEEQMKDEFREKLDTMTDDGFLDEKRRKEIEKALEEKGLKELDKLQQDMKREASLYEKYDAIREEVIPLVDEWFRYFAERLPRRNEVEVDEDSVTRQGSFNRRSVMKPRNLIFGTVKNPREIRSYIEPRFMASILIDVSLSMKDDGKLESARKLLVFYSELFNRISEEFGYIKFSIYVFSNTIATIKSFNQGYDSPERYDYEDGSRSTVKMRLMNKVTPKPGTNMLGVVKKAAGELNEEIKNYPDYASALYFIGDGGDTWNNSENVKRFMESNDSEKGFGEHMHSALLLGPESERKVLADVFGDEHTIVVSDFDLLIERSMNQFEDDMEEYLKTKGAIA